MLCTDYISQREYINFMTIIPIDFWPVPVIPAQIRQGDKYLFKRKHEMARWTAGAVTRYGNFHLDRIFNTMKLTTDSINNVNNQFHR